MVAEHKPSIFERVTVTELQDNGATYIALGYFRIHRGVGLYARMEEMDGVRAGRVGGRQLAVVPDHWVGEPYHAR